MQNSSMKIEPAAASEDLNANGALQIYKKRKIESNENQVALNQPLMDEPWDNALAEVRIQMIHRNEELQRKASNSKQEAEQLKEDYEKSKQKINNLKTENDDLNTKNEDLNTQLENLKTQNVDLKTLNEDLKTLNEDLKTQNKDLNTNVENLTTKVEDLKAQNGEYQKQAEASVRMVNQYETKFGFPHRIKIDGQPYQSCISEVQNKVFKLDGWNGDYPIFKATSKYGDEDVYLVHEKKYDATQNKLKKMREKTMVRNQSDQIDVQMKIYAKLTKGNTEFELDTGYWMISNKRSGGFAWCRIMSDVNNPLELDGKFWEEFSSVGRFGNSMDFNDGNCDWRSVYNSWKVTGSNYQIPE